VRSRLGGCKGTRRGTSVFFGDFAGFDFTGPSTNRERRLAQNPPQRMIGRG
jgi:hypothetical protein